MKTHAAPHKQALKKRVNRFFNSSTQCRADVYDFVDILTKNNRFDVYAFGGLVRDIGLFGVRDFSSDVDLVVEASRPVLKKAISVLPKSSVTENKFGGFRIKQGAWDIDIWCARDTWAIKNNLVTYRDVTSLLQTTFLSWDSALFDIRNQSLICQHGYLDDLNNGSLDIVLKESPNELGSMVRLTRAIYSKGAKELKSNALEVLEYYLGKYADQDIVAYEMNSYHKVFLSLSKLRVLRDEVRASSASSKMKVNLVGQLPLPLDFSFDGVEQDDHIPRSVNRLNMQHRKKNGINISDEEQLNLNFKYHR
ncbi:hypothetical protein ACXHQJ_16585 [Vibrio vulnificus]|uniref:Poly A polymerase head domain-containing protein n=1 Tax=Vibrio vulnificus TaxID=672 RepID=A0A8H9TGN5_VIBVL|nr:hypothetical protein [Vibrio vulnificus]EGQ9932833.1 hypothetical protein [Vibrio vulnificus]ELI0349888.1 hypothetical protein [Vibrio vulnificus]ELI0611564.1 hypothetical protein [Vibrio vulnificus]MCU8224208.1 hypothetical protein [Vibrio vulnificus]MCU8272110.1 hypothetical protein [Vibrio vulnificus]